MSNRSTGRPLEARAAEPSQKGGPLRPVRPAVVNSPRPPAAGEGESHGMSPSFVLKAVGHWWKLALPVGLLLAAAAGTAVWFLFRPEYRAKALLEIKSRAPHIAYEQRDDEQKFVSTQIEILKSPLVLGPVVAKPEVARIPEIMEAEEPTDWLARNIRVVSKNRSELFEITFDNPDARAAALVVNSVVEEFDKRNQQNRDQQMQRVVVLLEEEKDRRKRDVERLRQNVRELAKQVSGKDPLAGSQGTVMVMDHPLEALQTDLTKVEVEREVLQAQLTALRGGLDAKSIQIPEAVVRHAADESSEVAYWRGVVAQKQLKLRAIESSSAHGRRDPQYLRLAREIARDQAALEEARKAAIPQIMEDVKARHLAEQGEAVRQMEAALSQLKAKETLLRTKLKEKLISLGHTEGQALDLEFARSELSRKEKVFELIAARSLELQTERRAPARVRLLKGADVPQAPLPFSYRNMGLAMGAAFLLPFGCCVLLERTVRRISDADQLEDQSRVEVVGEISELPLKRAAKGVQTKAASLYEESIDSLRTCLALSEEHRDVKVLAVSSAVPGEGKTSIASQLAVSFARASGRPTLLIDGDMRAPDIHDIFEVPIEPGLVDVLAGDIALEEAIITTWSKYVHILPAGILDMSPHKLLGDGRLRGLLDRAKASYQNIVIDTPPVLSASEALVLARESDGALVCAMRDKSRGRQLQLAQERLVNAGARPVGAVLNNVPARKFAETYGSYSYRYRRNSR